MSASWPRTPSRPRLILASNSPRRRELLNEAGYDFAVVPPADSAESGDVPGETPSELVVRLARQKAHDVAQRTAEGIVVGCDTVAECDGQVLGKPTDLAHARQMLRTLRGRSHRVHSGLCLIRQPGGMERSGLATTNLEMLPLADAAIEEYLAGGQWQGKSGAFGLQDRLGWIRVVEGSQSNVVGLPMELLAALLAEVTASV